MWGMTLSSIALIRNPYCTPGTPFLTSLPDTVLIEISTQNFQGIFLGVNKHHSWCQEWPCSPCLRSETLNVLQVPPFLTPPSWHTSNWDINMKFSGYLPCGKKTSFMTSGMTISPMSPVRNRQCPPSTPLLDPSWHTSNWYINRKFSGYLPWCKKTSFMTSGMTMSSMSTIRNPQHPSSPPLPDKLLIKISTWNFQGIFLSV